MEDEEQEKIPLFKKWSHWYIIEIGFLLLLIIFFYLFTKHFA
jgi:hypothetical protein